MHRLIFLFLLLLVQNLNATEHQQISIAIIIDDLGYKMVDDQRAVKLPGAVTLSFLPYAPYSRALAEQAFSQGNEIMLHLPMQAIETLNLGPGAVTLAMNEAEFKQSVAGSIASIPHISGINNHMGSLITSLPEQMSWLMELIRRDDLYFIDSRTTTATVAELEATKFQIPNSRRNVFLDNERHKPAIEYQFKHLLKLAKKQGSAIAIGHPFPETLAILEQQIPELERAGIKLVYVSQLINTQQRREHRWQTSLSHSHRAVKN